MHVNQARYISNSQQFETAYFFTAEGECSEMRNLPMQMCLSQPCIQRHRQVAKMAAVCDPTFSQFQWGVAGCCPLCCRILRRCRCGEAEGHDPCMHGPLADLSVQPHRGDHAPGPAAQTKQTAIQALGPNK